MRFLSWLLALALALVSPLVTKADQVSTSGVTLQDEGTDQGRVQKLNCTGAGVTCSKSGAVGTINVSAGGGSLTVREVDASPSVSSVTTLEFDQGAGFIVTDETGGVARVSSSGGGGGLSHSQVMTRTSYGF